MKKRMELFAGFPPGVTLLLVNSFLMSLGFYSLVPFLSYYLTHQLGWTTALTGALLMVRQISQQGLMFLTGMLADRLGYKGMIAGGMVIRGIGFALFAWFTHPLGLFAAAMITGLGGAMFEPTENAALTELTRNADRGRIYALNKVLGNLGLASSAFLGSLFLHMNFAWLSVICGGLFLLTAVFTFWWLPNIQVQSQSRSLWHMSKTVVQDRRFLQSVLVQMCYYFMFMQFYITIPLRATAILHSVDGVALVNLLFAVLVIVLQVPMSRLMERFELLNGIKAGLMLMGAGLLLLGTTERIAVFVMGFVAFAVGDMVVGPSNFELTTRLAKPEMTATYFGFASMAIAVGGGLSQGLGGWLLEVGQGVGVPGLVWVVCGGVGLLGIWGVGRIAVGLRRRSESARKSVIS